MVGGAHAAVYGLRAVDTRLVGKTAESFENRHRSGEAFCPRAMLLARMIQPTSWFVSDRGHGAGQTTFMVREETVMRIGAVLVHGLGIAILGWTLAAFGGPAILAQEATPEAMEEPAGVSIELVAAGAAETLPPAPALLAIFRAEFEPGAVFQFPADDPDTGLFVVESGVMTASSTVPVVVTRGGDPEDTEVMAAETTFTLEPGDSFVNPPNSGGEFRNDGEEPVVLLVAAVEVAAPDAG